MTDDLLSPAVDESSVLAAAQRLARLAAVQVLYGQHFAPSARATSGFGVAALEEEGEGAPEETAAADDTGLCAVLVQGVEAEVETWDAMITGALDSKRPAARLELLLRVILRAGAFELTRCGSTPTGRIISDYVDVTRGFFDGKEPGLVNAVLDRIARTVRDSIP